MSLIIVVMITIATGALIGLFLSGILIDNPYKGTPKGGMFSAIGTEIIIIGMIFIGYVLNLITRKINNGNRVQ